MLSLLRSGLWLASPDDDSCYGLSSDGWEAVFRLARQQTVTGIAYRGLQFLPDRVLPPEPLLMRWTAVVDAVERKNREMDRTLAGLYSEFRSLGLDPVLQKGQGVAQLYEEPLLRECGDIDFYFNSRMAMELSSSYVRKRGIRVVEHADRSVFYVWKGVEVEREAKPITIHSITLDKIALPYADFTVSCSKGTYVRTLCADVGAKLGCGACLYRLNRLKSGEFDLANAITIETLKTWTQDDLNDYISGFLHRKLAQMNHFTNF